MKPGDIFTMRPANDVFDGLRVEIISVGMPYVFCRHLTGRLKGREVNWLPDDLVPLPALIQLAEAAE